MDANRYQELAARTLIDDPGFILTNEEMMLVWVSIGLPGEVGEVMELIKKGVFHRHGVDREALRKELGDVLWYVAGACSVLGLSMNDVMAENIEKLKLRYPEGYSSEASKARSHE